MADELEPSFAAYLATFSDLVGDKRRGKHPARADRCSPSPQAAAL